MKKLIPMAILTMIVSGCATVGPKAVKQANQPYNEALIAGWKEQMLLNLVRLRYGDTPYFMEVAGLNTKYSLSGSVGFSPTVNFKQGSTTNKWTSNTSVSYSEEPTITYKPLTGSDFVKRMLSSLSTQGLLELTRSGWSVERVMNICCERIEDHYNAPEASGPIVRFAPERGQFARVTELMNSLYKAGVLEMITEKPVQRFKKEALEGGSAEIAYKDPSSAKDVFLHVNRRLGMKAELDEFFKLTDIDPSEDVIEVKGKFKPADEGKPFLNIRTRSVQGILYFLSHSVKVPEQDIEDGLVVVTKNADGTDFDWQSVLGGAMKVHSCSGAHAPVNAAVCVKYRGTWFYILDSDADSKATLTLLSQLVNMQSTSSSAKTPMLTLPI